nr:MAG TPA: hypothetical protein [Caudoviricetes sp.]
MFLVEDLLEKVDPLFSVYILYPIHLPRNSAIFIKMSVFICIIKIFVLILQVN